MAAAYFIIAILGCGEAEAPCETVRTLNARYESQAACTAATEAALSVSADVDFPVIVAQCVAAGTAPKRLVPGDVERPGPGQAPVRADLSPVRS
jgi:hypothetical protein